MTEDQLKELKSNMEKFMETASGFLIGIHKKMIEGKLERFDDLTENDLGYLAPLIKKWP